jgi:hypothetical protein
MLGKGFALSLELVDLVAAFFNGLLELTLVALIGFDLLRLQFMGQLDFCELEQFTAA